MFVIWFPSSGATAVPPDKPVEVTQEKESRAKKFPANRNHISSSEDKSYNYQPDLETDKEGEVENIGDNQSLEGVEEGEISNLIEDLREAKLDTSFTPMKPILYDWFHEFG